MGVLFKSKPVDKAKTGAKVRAFFKKDVQELQAMAGRKLTGFITSPNLTKTGSSDHAINGIESCYLEAVNADKELETIAAAVNTCSEKTKKIIIMRCIEERPCRQMEEYFCVSPSQYYLYQQKALCEFATNYARYGRELRAFTEN